MLCIVWGGGGIFGVQVVTNCNIQNVVYCGGGGDIWWPSSD